MAWAVPEFSKQQVNSAAKKIMNALYSSSTEQEYNLDELDNAIIAVNNWRSCHGFPMNTFQVNLRNASGRYDNNFLVSQRTKRLVSILHKLERFEKMKLTQMQDIGGCRAVVKNVTAVKNLVDYYTTESQVKHKLATYDNYINSPKASGYRGVHLVYRYFSDRTEVYNGLKIEIQLRSQYQHAWATAVETVGTFVSEALKSSWGSEDWLRFFTLMGSAIALREKTPLVPDTPVIQSELIGELKHYTNSLNVINRLRAYGDAIRMVEESASPNHDLYLLELDPNVSQLTIKGYSRKERDRAQQEYADAEKRVRENPRTDAVLVSVNSVAYLRRAYPNYFADTRVFVELVEQALEGRHKKIVIANA